MTDAAGEGSEPARREEMSLDDSSGMGEAREQLDAPGEDVYEPGTGSDNAMPAGHLRPVRQGRLVRRRGRACQR
jgi:RNA polymerase sigma-54 factor